MSKEDKKNDRAHSDKKKGREMSNGILCEPVLADVWTAVQPGRVTASPRDSVEKLDGYYLIRNTTFSLHGFVKHVKKTK